MRVDATSHADATGRIVDWARAGESRAVCIASVNNVMEAHDDPAFGEAMESADLVTADGMPLVWCLRWLGVSTATRVSGADLLPHILAAAAAYDVPVAFYGGSPAVLGALVEKVVAMHPGLRVPYAVSPPFRRLTPEEEERTRDELRTSGSRIVFVGLGCPKQERWMAASRGQLGAVTVGVGAAFDFLAGSKRRAPVLLQRLGLEWAFRLACEPRRLWRRYLRHNPRFVFLFGSQVFRERVAPAITSRRNGRPRQNGAHP
jgi:N-acetylglucosaminyldiphosphoundecaprenol N-acetyl-beta-D-mannosaminyltransferase